jgi:hypothetical protein
VGQAEPGVVEGLLQRLGDEEARVRRSAASALGGLGQAEPGVIDGLLQRLGDEDANVRSGAASALGGLGQAEPGVIDGLLQRLGDEDANVRTDAVAAFRALRTDPRAVSALLTTIGDRNEVVSAGATFAVDTGSGLRFFEEEDPTIAPQHLSPLKQFLDSEMEVDCSIFFDFLEKHRRVKDVAWELLRRYSEETGERIYRDDGGG